MSSAMLAYTVRELADTLHSRANELEELIRFAPADLPVGDNKALIERSRVVANSLIMAGDTGGVEDRAEKLLKDLQDSIENWFTETWLAAVPFWRFAGSARFPVQRSPAWRSQGPCLWRRRRPVGETARR